MAHMRSCHIAALIVVALALCSCAEYNRKSLYCQANGYKFSNVRGLAWICPLDSSLVDDCETHEKWHVRHGR